MRLRNSIKNDVVRKLIPLYAGTNDLPRKFVMEFTNNNSRDQVYCFSDIKTINLRYIAV